MLNINKKEPITAAFIGIETHTIIASNNNNILSRHAGCNLSVMTTASTPATY
jgi:hypothetical protein